MTPNQSQSSKPLDALKILYCENNVDGTVGGSYYSLLYLVKNLDRQRYHPIVVFYTDHTLLASFKEAGVETYVWSKAKTFSFANRRHTIWKWLRPFRPIALLLQKTLNVMHEFVFPAFARVWFIKRHDVCMVHLNNSILYNHDWMWAAKLAGIKCVTHERGINESFTATAKYFARRIDAIICISEAVRQNMQVREVDFGNLITIHNGLDPDSAKLKAGSGALRAAYGIDADAVIVGMVGNIKEWKGQDTLVRAIGHVRDKVPSIRCLFVGDTAPSDRDYERSLLKLVDSLELGKHIVFVGFQKNVPDFLMLFDVVIHASVLPEPFGRVILEAMACKKPVIGARAGAIPEIVEEGITGLTFTPGDAHSLAGAIVELVTDQEKSRRFGVNGYDRLVKHFHISRNIEATQQLYERILCAAR